MNRNQRRYCRTIPNKDDKLKVTQGKNDFEEILSPKRRRNHSKFDKFVANRSCSVKPNQKDVEQSVHNHSIDVHFKCLTKQQCDFDPIYVEGTKNPKPLRNVVCSSHSTNVNPFSLPRVETIKGFQRQNADSTADHEQLSTDIEDTPIPETIDSKNIYISEVPRIKVIAEKFAKFSTNNVELRKLEEKIVCIEYDVFDNILLGDSTDKSIAKPVQIMRAYFSVRPTSGEKRSDLQSTIKHKFHITGEDVGKLNEKEIEIIDAKIAENKQYLDELKRVLKRKQAIYDKKKKSSLDLKSLYEMAKRETASLDEDFSNTNLLSKSELEEIKELIAKQCNSTIHGIYRHTLKYGKDKESQEMENINMDVISKSIFAELIRNDEPFK